MNSLSVARSFRTRAGAIHLARLVLGLFKLRIAVMIMITALVGLAVTPGPALSLLQVVVLALAVLLASASAGAFNQYFEADADRLMARTRTRAFVTGELPHTPAWLVLIAALLALAVGAAWWALNAMAALHIFLGAFVYAVVYTVWLKRRSWTNIVIGGLAGSFAVLAGGAAVDPALGPLPALLALVLFLWTPPHFWSLAIANQADYAAAGVPMLPVVVGTAARGAHRVREHGCAGRGFAVAGAVRRGAGLHGGCARRGRLLPAQGLGAGARAEPQDGDGIVLRVAASTQPVARCGEHRRFAALMRGLVAGAPLSALIDRLHSMSTIRATAQRESRRRDALSHGRPAAIALIVAIALLALWALPASGARITPVATPPGQPPPAAAETPPDDPPPPALDATQALRDSQAAIGRPLGEHALLDTQGRPVRLSNYRGKPLLVSFIYTGCFQVCPTSTRSLQEAVRTVHKTFRAEHFNVVSIGFNQPADSPQAMRAFAAQHRIAEPNWQFLSPPPAALPALLRDFGFSVLATPAGFDHLVGVTVVDAQGRIYAQVYGEKFNPDQLGEPLRLLLRGAPMPAQLSLGELIERVRIICTVYDPQTGRYKYNYGLIVEIAGGATFIVAMLWFFTLELRNRWRRRAQQRALPAADVAL